jgi:hypothetical protein
MYTSRQSLVATAPEAQLRAAWGCIVSQTGRKEPGETDRAAVGWHHAPRPRPPGVTQDVHTAQLRKLKPDVSAARPKQHEDPEGPAQVYTWRSRPHPHAIQRPTNARTQHTDLANMLTAHGHTVTTVPNPGGRYRHHLHRAHPSNHQLGVTHDQASLLPETVTQWQRQPATQHHRHTTTA